jgi:hypothetical protein
LVGKPEPKIQFGIRMGKNENSVQIDPKETGFEDVDCVNVGRYRIQLRALVNTVIIDYVPQNVKHFLISRGDCSIQELHSIQLVSQFVVLLVFTFYCIII